MISQQNSDNIDQGLLFTSLAIFKFDLLLQHIANNPELDDNVLGLLDEINSNITQAYSDIYRAFNSNSKGVCVIEN